MFQASVEGLGRAVGGAGPVEMSQYVRGPLGQGSAQAAQLGQRGGTPSRRQPMSARIASRALVRSGSRWR